MTLPRLLVLTDRRLCRRPLPEVVAAAVDGGARAVVLREKDLPAAQRSDLADAVRAVLAPVGGQLILAGTSVPGPAVHLAVGEAVPVPRPVLVGRSCHNAAEVARAAAEDSDYVTVSPVHPSPSKPGYGPALGTVGLGALVRAAGASPVHLSGSRSARPAPAVYALGGVTADNAASCMAAGAAGVAVMGAVMRAARPDRCVEDLLAALTETLESPC